MQVVRVSIAEASFAEVVSLIGPHHDLVSSITRGDDEWTVTFRQCASIEFIVNGLLERAATEFGLVAGHRGLEDETPMEPWEAHDAVCNGECLNTGSRFGLKCGHCGITYSAEADETDDGVCRKCDETGKVTADQARDAAIRFLSMPYTAKWHMIDTLDIDVEVDRNNNSHQQSIIWLGRVRDANKIRELIRLLDEKEGDR